MLKTRSTLRSTIATCTLAVALLGAAGCASDAPGGPDMPPSATATEQAPETHVYQFDQARVVDEDDQMPFISSGLPVEIRLSDELKAAAPEGAFFPVESYTVTAKAFPTGICRLDVEITYAEGGKERLLGSKSDSQSDAQRVVSTVRILPPSVEVETRSISPSDDEIIADDIYLTSDLGQMSSVGECGTTDSLRFSYLTNEGGSEIDSLATAMIISTPTINEAQNEAQIEITAEVNADVSPTGAWVRRES